MQSYAFILLEANKRAIFLIKKLRRYLLVGEKVVPLQADYYQRGLLPEISWYVWIGS